MFSGFQEILLIGLILAGLFVLPRMATPRPRPARLRRPAKKLPWTFRLAIVLSFLWPAAWALYLNPWQKEMILFAVVGLAPVVVGWSVRWIIAGRKDRR